MTTLRRVAVLAPMKPELKAIVKSFSLEPTPDDPVFSHAGTAGSWAVAALVTGMGPALAREATRKALSAGPFDHVMVIGIAGGLDPGPPRRIADGARAACQLTRTAPSSGPARFPRGRRRVG